MYSIRLFISACISLLAGVLLTGSALAQKPAYTHADTLRGSITPERSWWNVLYYAITVKPDEGSKTITGKNSLRYQVTQANKGRKMQLDLQKPLVIDSVLWDGIQRVPFEKEGNAWHVWMPEQQKGSIHRVDIYYGGKVHEAIRPPWDGGWVWGKDSLGRPYMTVACQGLGASIWYPCKDHQSDEPDSGASLTMIVPDSLVAVGNGRLQHKQSNGDGTTTYTWAVVNPISNYCIIPYIGKYVNFSEVYNGEKGPLSVNYWVLDYNQARAKEYMPTQVHNMLKSFEYWMGPYPFYEDGYQLIDASHTGMEHQSAVSYGNRYAFGYRGRDQSNSGLGLKFDFIIIHESGHEWFGNNITTNDLADMWVHESFTNYSETLFADYIFGEEAGNAYNYGIRAGIRNDAPIIPVYGVNAQGSGDMYPKGGNMLHTIRHGMGNDSLFRSIIRGLNSTFYHTTVNAADIENYISKRAGFDYSKVFSQYLLTTQIPRFEYYFSADKKQVSYRYANCIKGFTMPLLLQQAGVKIKLIPADSWKSQPVNSEQAALFTPDAIQKMYYLKVVEGAQ
ncbi:M1 family metallopeptidase [Filimonas lacunae]|nr:M1 family metallopeptidase [Filimonas lacunae]BAV05918.1 peptidase, M1 family [Filimonas lacunae]